MTDSPSISIIIPVYNSLFIESCLQSCAKQTIGIEDLEIIVVDDASSNNKIAQLEKLQDHFDFELIRLPKNAGPAAARNAGLEMAKGEFICFLDSDDMMRPDKLEKQLSYARSNPSVGAIISGIEEIDIRGITIRELIRDFPVDHKRQIELIFLDNLHTVTSTLFFKRDLLKSIGVMDPELLNLEDMEFALRILKATEMVYLPEALTIRRVLSDGLSQSVSVSLFKESRTDFYTRATSIYPALSSMEGPYWSLNYARLGRILQRQGKGKSARKYYVNSIKYRLNLIAIAGLILTFLPTDWQTKLAAMNWRRH